MANDVDIKLRSILRDYVNLDGDIESIEPEDRLSEWGLNSSGVLKLMMGIEIEFGVELSFEDFDPIIFESIEALTLFMEKRFSMQ